MLLWGFLLMPIFAVAQPGGQNDGKYEVYRYDNGKVSSEGYMLDGRPEGYWKTYYPDGTLKSEGNRKNFMLDSTWVFYSESGQPTTSINYVEGMRQGEVITFKDGVKYKVAHFDKDTLQDFTKFLYPTGEVHKRVPYEDGIEEGDGFEYARDGRIITLLTYREGYLRSAEKINRYDSQGRKRGPWKTYHPNGSLAMEGTYVNGEKNGIFKTFDRKGNLLTLEKFKEGEPVTDSEQAIILDLRSTYYPDGSVKSTGGYVEGKREGTHRFYDKEGEISGGAVYHLGEKTGEGIVDREGNMQGAWKLYYDTGDLKAEGQYVDNERTGDWVFYHRNGQVEHKGKYKDGLPQGKWLWYFDNGNLRREEYYRRGKEDGAETEYDIEGEVVAQGEYTAGYKEGEWFYHVGDHTEKGSYRDGERTGEWVYMYPDEKLQYRGEYVAGLPVGRHQWYYPNGQIMKEGKYNSGIRVGTWKKYDKNGVELLNVKYKNGLEYKINGRTVVQTPGEAPVRDI